MDHVHRLFNVVFRFFGQPIAAFENDNVTLGDTRDDLSLIFGLDAKLDSNRLCLVADDLIYMRFSGFVGVYGFLRYHQARAFLL